MGPMRRLMPNPKPKETRIDPIPGACDTAASPGVRPAPQIAAPVPWHFFSEFTYFGVS